MAATLFCRLSHRRFPSCTISRSRQEESVRFSRARRRYCLLMSSSWVRHSCTCRWKACDKHPQIKALNRTHVFAVISHAILYFSFSKKTNNQQVLHMAHKICKPIICSADICRVKWTFQSGTNSAVAQARQSANRTVHVHSDWLQQLSTPAQTSLSNMTLFFSPPMFPLPYSDSLCLEIYFARMEKWQETLKTSKHAHLKTLYLKHLKQAMHLSLCLFSSVIYFAHSQCNCMLSFTSHSDNKSERDAPQTF